VKQIPVLFCIIYLYSNLAVRLVASFISAVTQTFIALADNSHTEVATFLHMQ